MSLAILITSLRTRRKLRCPVEPDCSWTCWAQTKGSGKGAELNHLSICESANAFELSVPPGGTVDVLWSLLFDHILIPWRFSGYLLTKPCPFQISITLWNYNQHRMISCRKKRPEHLRPQFRADALCLLCLAASCAGTTRMLPISGPHGSASRAKNLLSLFRKKNKSFFKLLTSKLTYGQMGR